MSASLEQRKAVASAFSAAADEWLGALERARPDGIRMGELRENVDACDKMAALLCPEIYS